jgi:hypothetical protein
MREPKMMLPKEVVTERFKAPEVGAFTAGWNHLGECEFTATVFIKQNL